jgi:hypothetical protein
MRIPFITRRVPEDLRSIAERATRVRSAEAAWPRLRATRTLEENREVLARRRARANGEPPS